ncbi:hypothetical protein HDU92_009121 [Lobulomyces angularis]|nr:hypothetical protein HDU92_009121 [Lobulomyces angularis]
MSARKKLIVYHTNWSMYGRNYHVSNLPIDKITDINYAFLDLKQSDAYENFFVPTLSDPWSDVDKRYTDDTSVPPPDTWNDDNSFPFGNFGQFVKLKKLGKKFNFGISIGGWTFSKYFSSAVSSEASRKKFVDAVADLIKKFSLINRVDLDWEYISPPGKNYGLEGNIVGEGDGYNFGLLLQELRNRLNQSFGENYIEISACVTSDPSKISALPLKEMSLYLDTINIMTYDFNSSAWGPVLAGHQTNLYPSLPYAPLSVTGAVEAYIKSGIVPSKIVIGVAFYSRGFANTEGLGKPSNGVVEDMSWEQGVCDYKSLPRPGSTEYWDSIAHATYSYDPVKKILNSYDSVDSIKAKCEYVWEKGLAGIIVWESSGDVMDVNDSRSLFRALNEGLASRK